MGLKFMKKILIVDDNPKIRKLVGLTLRGIGDYQVLEAESGEQAIEVAAAEEPELIIMDIMMPGDLDGLRATRILKNHPQTKDAVIIFLTAKGQPIDKEKGFEAGAADYLVKPFSPAELIRKVEEMLESDKHHE